MNVVIEDTQGQLQSSTLTPFDQIFHLGALLPEEERQVSYRARAEYNIDTFVVWEDGRTARYNFGYVTDGWGAPVHDITIVAEGLLFDGVPPIDVQSEPEKYFDKYRPKRWDEDASKPPLK